MINELKKAISYEVVNCKDPNLLDLIYKILLNERKEGIKSGDKRH